LILCSLILGANVEHSTQRKRANYLKKMNHDKREETMKKAFEIFDKGSKGCITIDDLRQIIDEVGEMVPEEEIRLMIQEADQDKDGVVNYSEFSNMYIASD